MKKYLIFNKRDPYTPLSRLSENGNVVIEGSLDDVKEYIKKLNKKVGENLFYYMEMKEWQEKMNSPEFEEFCNMFDRHMKEIANFSDLENNIRQVYRECDKNINGFSLPYIADNNEDYERKLREKLDAFVKEIDRPAFQKEGTLVSDVRSICKRIIEAFIKAKSGDLENAEKIVIEILKDYEKNPFAVTELDKSYAFRMVAPFDDLQQKWVPQKEYKTMMEGELNFFRGRVVAKTEKLQTVEEINYLPYSKRTLANDMRFSSKGNICLYLGTTTYVCSKECRWDGGTRLYLSSFKFNDKGKALKILNMVVLEALLNGLISNPGESSYHRELHNTMIKIFPLAIATMYTIRTPDEERKQKYNETNKAEYLLSQVLMTALNKAGIDGVAYLSRQGKNDFQYPQMVCLAIPVMGASEQNEYGELIKDFVMTSPVLFNGFEGEKIYKEKSYINEKCPKYLNENIENFSAKIDYEGETVFYQDTLFSKMDDFLINQIHGKPLH